MTIYHPDIPFETETELKKRGTSKTPDILFLCPVSIKIPKNRDNRKIPAIVSNENDVDYEWKMICWIDSKVRDFACYLCCFIFFRFDLTLSSLVFFTCRLYLEIFTLIKRMFYHKLKVMFTDLDLVSNHATQMMFKIPCFLIFSRIAHRLGSLLVWPWSKLGQWTWW